MIISVCIPTYRRPEMLKICVESVFGSTYRPLEIVVSDDDHRKSAEAVIKSAEVPSDVSLSYLSNRGPRGQSRNLRNALQAARGELVSVIHDDDFYLPGGIDALMATWIRGGCKAEVVFGRQLIVDATGNPLPGTTDGKDKDFFKPHTEVFDIDPLTSALQQQWPNNGWMMTKDLVLRSPYPDETEVGHVPVDFYFSVMAALQCRSPLNYTPRRVSAYRLTEASVLRGRRTESMETGHLGYERLKNIEPVTDEQASALDLAKSRFAASAVRGYIVSGQSTEAWHVLRAAIMHMPVSYGGRLRLLLGVALANLKLRSVALLVLKLRKW